MISRELDMDEDLFCPNCNWSGLTQEAIIEVDELTRCPNCSGVVVIEQRKERMRSDFDSVGDFHQKFNLDNATFIKPGPREVPRALIDFRLRFLIEELKETAKGLGVDLEVTMERREPTEIDIVSVADGLVDLNYVSCGTAHVLGLPWPQLFAEVQRANMTKERAVRAEQSARGSTFDVIKPPGWTPPDIAGILRTFGWKV